MPAGSAALEARGTQKLMAHAGTKADGYRPLVRWKWVAHIREAAKLPPHQSPGRLKQWLGLMRRSYPQAEKLYGEIRELRRAPDISLALEHCGMRLERPHDAWQPVEP